MNDESSCKRIQVHMDLHSELKLSCGPEKKRYYFLFLKKRHLKENLFKTALHSAQEKKSSCCTIFNSIS